ncbi:DUF945 family protein [Vibrio sinensis]|uniref:DUF945 family protein n=2 Tax=Vibrio sinensis TaxID=2302434 RepID=A0A3A6QM39_9VIBR|nr:DUF945 family protein [Vibrio sinensis]
MKIMQQLKKYAAIGGAISLVLCWPLAVGQIGKNVIEDSVKHLNTDSVTAEIVQYDRGYLSSTAQTRYTVTDATLIAQLTADGLPTEIIVNSEISHGLFSLTADSTLQDLPEIPLSLHTYTQLNGNTDYLINLDTWNQVSEGENGAMLSVTPSTLSGHVTVLGEMTYELNVPSLEVDFNSGEKLLLSKLTGEGQGKKVQGFWIGEQTVKLADMTVLDAVQTPLFAVKGSQYEFNAQLDEAKQRVTTQHVVKSENLLFEQQKYSQLEVDFSFGDLDVNAFEQLMDIYQNDPMITAEDADKIIPHVETLFSRGFFLSMNQLALNVGDGQFESQWKLEVPEGTQGIVQDPFKLMKVLKGNFAAFLSNSLVESNPFIKQNVDEGVIMEAIKQNDKGYQFNAELVDGNLQFENGQKIPLMNMLLPMMM